MAAEVVDRVQGHCGELVLRRDGPHAEIVANGMFLMDTRAGGSERRLVAEAVRRMPAPGRLLIGGLGVGFSLAEALRHPEVGTVCVVEVEPAVVRWNRGPLAGYHGDALSDPRVHCREADLVALLPELPAGSFDALCLDTDNGPDWLLTPGNAGLYSPSGLAALARVLAPGGVLSVWGSRPVPEFRGRLAGPFGQVEELAVHTGATRDVPDVVYLARR
jgi:spermidine synthase